ncbi:MAG: TolC family protein [Gammaproteobacteria bacterium]|nr:TolC family protein [Gammaproteobacteria bacterium]
MAIKNYQRRLVRFGKAFWLPLQFALVCPFASADDVPPPSESPKPKLPEPLTLEYVLNLDVKGHPSLQSATASLELQKANKELADSNDDFTANLMLDARAVEPNPIVANQGNNDSQAHLIIAKRLYDFGRTSAAAEAALADVEGSELLYADALNRHRIDIMSHFFAVLLADLRYARDNEAMSIGYVAFDRGRHRNNLGQMSDVELLKLENQFQIQRRAYFSSQADQRNMRSRLANIIDRPGELVSNLAEPVLRVPLAEMPEFEELQSRAMADNPVLKALRLQISAAEERVKEARSGRNPVLDGEARWSEYARDLGGYDQWRIGIVLDVPLIAGDSIKANIAKRNAELLNLRARMREAEMAVSQQLLESWQSLQNLKVGREQTDVLQHYRELYLDKSRTLYETEVQSDLGDAMVEITEARLQKAMVEYQLAIEWAKLQALTGQQVNVLQEQSNETAL